MAIDLIHSKTGRKMTVGDERVAAVHEKAGWNVIVKDGETVAPERPAEGSPGRRWLDYAVLIGLEVDERKLKSVDELIALIDAHEAAGAEDDAPADDEPMPETITALVAWIGDDPTRAQTALDAEGQRTTPRKTVTEHAEATLAAQTQET